MDAWVKIGKQGDFIVTLHPKIATLQREITEHLKQAHRIDVDESRKRVHMSLAQKKISMAVAAEKKLDELA